MPARRAVLLQRSDADSCDIEQLATEHGLDIVFTAFVDLASPRLSLLIAVEHILDSGVDAIIIPHLTDEAVREAKPWQLLVEMVDVVTMSGVLGRVAGAQ